jgi:hypothetical protein
MDNNKHLGIFFGLISKELSFFQMFVKNKFPKLSFANLLKNDADCRIHSYNGLYFENFFGTTVLSQIFDRQS